MALRLDIGLPEERDLIDMADLDNLIGHPAAGAVLGADDGVEPDHGVQSAGQSLDWPPKDGRIIGLGLHLVRDTGAARALS